MLFMVHCDFEKGSQNQHFKGTLLVGSEGITKIIYSVYSLDNVHNLDDHLVYGMTNQSSLCLTFLVPPILLLDVSSW